MNVGEIQTFEHDVLVIGAGGAGLRAAIECSARGLNTGVISKSLLGKAHTVMAEGGMAASLGNVDRRDNWKIHFRDTMRGGKFLNQWRMAELHAKQAPERVREIFLDSGLQSRYESGDLNGVEFFEAFCQQSGSRPDYDAFVQAGSAIFDLNISILPVVTQLVSAGHRLGILSNTCEAHWRYLSDGRFRILR